MLKKVFLCVSIFYSLCVFSHGDLEERILAVTEEIKTSPDSPYLYFKRGKLYFQHQEFKKSLKDFNQSKLLGYNCSEQDLLFARNYFRLNNFEKTLFHTNYILDTDKKNVRALKLKAKTLMNLDRFQESALTFELVVDYADESFPENYIDASLSWEALNTSHGLNRASKIIETGIEKLGNLISLFDRLIDISVDQKDYKKAIEIQFKMLNIVSRKERAYYKLTELYLIDNNPNMAIETVNLAKEHFYRLPLRIQNTSFMKKLLADILSKEILLKPTK